MFTPLALFTVRPEGREEGSLEGFPLYPVYAACPVYPELRREPRSDPRRARRAFPSKSVPVPSSSDLRALCVSAFSFLPPPFNCSTSEPSDLQTTQSPRPFPDSLATRVKHKSFTCHSYEKQPGWGLPSFFKSVSHYNPPFTTNPHRITSFAYPHPLTPIESHSCKKQGGGGYYVGSRPYFIASLRLCFRLLFHSNKSGCSRVIRSHIGWNWNHPASGLPTCECVSLAVS
jgi:hypothetical protein